MDFLVKEAGESFSSGDGKFWKTVGLLNPITAPIIIGKSLKNKKDQKQQGASSDKATTPSDKPTPSGSATPSGGTTDTSQTQQGGMSKGAKIGLIVGGIAVVGLVIFLATRKK